MILAVPAIVVWYLMVRFRRTWTGVLCLALSMFFLAFIGLTLRRIHLFVDWEVIPAPFQVLWWSELAVILIIGLFILSLPRHVRDGAHCSRCGYDLKGLEEQATVCPECGSSSEADASPRVATRPGSARVAGGIEPQEARPADAQPRTTR